MFPSGLLILTQPLASLKEQITPLLDQVSQVVSDTLYVHLQPTRAGHTNTNILLNPVPVTSDIRNIVRDIYSVGFQIRRKLDILVLLNHVTNSDGKIAQCELRKEFSVVMLDDTTTSRELLEDKEHMLTQVQSAFLTTSHLEFRILKNSAERNFSSPELSEDPVLKIYDCVALGGTFDRLHVGHKILLTTSCMFAEKKLIVGITDGQFIENKVLVDLIQPAEERKKVVVEFLKEVKPFIQHDVDTFHDLVHNPVLEDPNIQCAIGSEETKTGLEKLNILRESKGLNQLETVVVDLIIDHDHAPDENEKISSSSLRKRSLGTLLQPAKSRPNLPSSPYMIGLTGGIASGRSAICRKLESLGAAIIDSDCLEQEAYKPGMSAFIKIKEVFGEDIVGDDGSIDRRKLDDIVSADEGKRQRLNGVVWAEIIKLVEAEISRFRENGEKFVVLYAAILLEAGWDNHVHEVWSAFLPRSEALKRTMGSYGILEEEAAKRLDSEIPNWDRISRSNVVLCTQWEDDYTQMQCEKAWKLLQERIIM